MADTSQLMKQLLPTVVILGMSRVDIVELGLLDAVRVLYFVIHAAVVAALFVIYQKMQAAPPDGIIKVPAVKQFGQEVKPAEEQTALDYDMGKLKEQVTQIAIGLVMISLMHFKWEYVIPLPIQCIMVPMNFLDSPLVKIYIYGKPAQGKLKRPFPAPGAFGMPAAEEPKETKKADKKKD